MRLTHLVLLLPLLAVACAPNPPGTEPNHYIHQLSLEGGGG